MTAPTPTYVEVDCNLVRAHCNGTKPMAPDSGDLSGQLSAYNSCVNCNGDTKCKDMQDCRFFNEQDKIGAAS